MDADVAVEEVTAAEAVGVTVVEAVVHPAEEAEEVKGGQSTTVQYQQLWT